MKKHTLLVCSLVLSAAACQNGLQPAPDLDSVVGPPEQARPLVDLIIPEHPEDYGYDPRNPPKNVHADANTKILFVNFDGATMRGGQCNNAAQNCSGIVQAPCATNTAFPAYTGTPAQRDQILQILRRYYIEFNIDIVTTRPASGNYSMVMVGGTPMSVCYPTSGALGVALLDCDNQVWGENDITFAFAEASGNDPTTIALTIAQEHAHAYGLEHTANLNDLLYPFAMVGVESGGYYDADMGILDASGQPSSSTCPSTRGQPTQNSYRRMLAVAGPSNKMDTETPTATITYPMDGQSGFRTGSNIRVRATLNDDFPPLRYRTVDLLIDEGTAAAQTISKTEEPFSSFTAQVMAEGPHTMQLKVTDSANHVGMSPVVHFTSGAGTGGAGAGGAGAGGGMAGAGGGAAGAGGGTGGTGGGTAGAGGGTAGSSGGAGGAGGADMYGANCTQESTGCLCVGNDNGLTGVCSRKCTTATQCSGASGFKCLDLYNDGSKYCAPADFAPMAKTTPASGCATGNGAGSPLALLPLLGLLFARRRRFR